LDWQVEIPPPVIVGGSADTSPPPVAPAFTVLETRTLRRDVAEAPPMPGLPPVEGRISVTVRKVADPGLPELPEPLPPTSPDDAAVQAQTGEFRENHKGTDLVFISATVYGNSRTFLRIQPNGSTGGEVTAWSNIDF